MGRDISLIDWNQVNSLKQTEHEYEMGLLRELLKLFVAENESRLDEIWEAVKTCDYDAINRAAHAISGSSANLGGCCLAATAAELEFAAESRADFVPWTELAQRLRVDYIETVDALERFIGGED